MSDNLPEFAETTTVQFGALDLIPPVLKAVQELGYDEPTPIQAQCIPLLLEGRDVLGQAQTGTGKTAAFALPALCRVRLDEAHTQVLVLTPTRELAIQVADAFASFAKHLPGFRIIPIYGGQSYTVQLRALARGPHVVVGTPGRVIDHINRGTLSLDKLTTFVLDEADEMLRMGFIDDVGFILEKAPADRQLVMFSATVPPPIRNIARKHQRNAAEIRVESKQASADGIRQRYIPVNAREKVPALMLLLETEETDGVLVFVRTKLAAAELSEALIARGVHATALSGDVGQAQRERTIDQLRNGQIDVVVATDVAARGLDVDRISHVINYDIPFDPESYVHRIGRTGRAGRQGEAILFVEWRERGTLSMIERVTRSTIEIMSPPSVAEINARRIAKFEKRVLSEVERAPKSEFLPLIQSLCEQHELDPMLVAAALAQVVQGSEPLLLKHAPVEDRTHLGRGGKKKVVVPSELPTRPPASDTRSESRPPIETRPVRSAAEKPARAPSLANEAERFVARAADERVSSAAIERPPRAEKASKAPASAGKSITGPAPEFATKPDFRAKADARATEDSPRRERPVRSDARREANPVDSAQPDFRAKANPRVIPEMRAKAEAAAQKPRPPVRVESRETKPPAPAPRLPNAPSRAPKKGMEWFRAEVGATHGATAREVVGAITNEAALDGRNVGTVEIHTEHSFVELPVGMPMTIFRLLEKTRVAGQKLSIKRFAMGPSADAPAEARPRKFAGKKFSREDDKAGIAPLKRKKTRE